jgi:hypothetical protein
MQTFISHSRKDTNGTTFVDKIFSGVENTAFLYSYQGPVPPHAQTLKKEITSKCNSLIVLLSRFLTQGKFTASWVSYEVGLAHAAGLNVWVLENINDDPIDLPIPYVSAYVQRTKALTQRSTFPFDFIGDFAGTVIPSIRDFGSTKGSKYIGDITCPNEKCNAQYSVFLERNWFFCPVCRKKFNTKNVNNIQRVR